MELKKIFRSRFVTALLLLAFSTVSFVTIELYLQKKQVDSEVERLQAQSDDLNKDNQDLSELIKYLNTPEYQEKEAREKLNLKKQGEEVVVLPESEGAQGSVAGASEELGNPKKWFNYFFKE